MAKFLKDDILNSELQKIIEDSKDTLILISPYIKLHEKLKFYLKNKIEEHYLNIFVVFGKNEDDISKSLSKEDFDFLKIFPNIEIRYQKRLHAKYYANESKGILTSMNLYSYSHDNNIEFGILTEKGNILKKDNVDADAWNFFKNVIQQSKIYFKRSPQYKSKLIGEKYTGSITEDDLLTELYENQHSKAPFQTKAKVTSINERSKYGFCIRTGEKIPFDPKHPFCRKAYESWAKYKDENYKEKYCHFSGEPSNGETSYSKPILKKNWKKAKEIFDL
ncbi:MAG: phospholipase D family protein [Weeksellaceae bacterium]